MASINSMHLNHDILQLMQDWKIPSEVVGGRKFTYLILGEAFDYLSLLERISLQPGIFIEKNQLEELLFYGYFPPHSIKQEIRKHLGWKKYKAFLNYWYGVVIEQCLQYVVEVEVRKEFLSKGLMEPDDVIDIVFGRLYGGCQENLLTEYLGKSHSCNIKSMSVLELEGYIYWLFQQRFEESDQSRFASDTLKALRYFEKAHKPNISKMNLATAERSY